MQGYARLGADMFDKTLRNRLTLYANRGNRDAWKTEACFDTLTFTSQNCRFGYLGGRRGVEYQSDIALGPLGLATIGSRSKPRRRRLRAKPGSSMITRRRTPSRRHGRAMRSISSRSSIGSIFPMAAASTR